MSVDGDGDGAVDNGCLHLVDVPRLHRVVRESVDLALVLLVLALEESSALAGVGLVLLLFESLVFGVVHRPLKHAALAALVAL